MACGGAATLLRGALRDSLLNLQHTYKLYSRTGDLDGSINLVGWEKFVRDALLITRSEVGGAALV